MRSATAVALHRLLRQHDSQARPEILGLISPGRAQKSLCPRCGRTQRLSAEDAALFFLEFFPFKMIHYDSEQVLAEHRCQCTMGGRRRGV